MSVSKGHIESEHTEPTIAGHTLKAGQKYEVKAVPVKDPQVATAMKVGGRLCGGTDTCLALVEI
jgi:hypothetical protein